MNHRRVGSGQEASQLGLETAKKRIAELEAELAALKAQVQQWQSEAAEAAGHELGLWPMGAVAAVGGLKAEVAGLRKVLEYEPVAEGSLSDHAAELVRRYKAVCARLQETAQKHSLGLGGNPVVESVCDGVDKLAAEVAVLRERLAAISSFAYGNVKMHNSSLNRSDIDKAIDAMVVDVEALREDRERLKAALRKAVDVYGVPGGPWSVPSDPGSWIAQAREALGEEPEAARKEHGK